jgi:hypothetical protein
MVFNSLGVKLGRSVLPWLPFDSYTEVTPRCLLFCHFILYTNQRCPILNIYFQAYFRCSRYSAPAPYRRICPPQSIIGLCLPPASDGVRHGLCGTAKKCDLQQRCFEVRNKLSSHDYGRCWWHWCSVVIEVDMSADTETSAYPTTQDEGNSLIGPTMVGR